MADPLDPLKDTGLSRLRQSMESAGLLNNLQQQTEASRKLSQLVAQQINLPNLSPMFAEWHKSHTALGEGLKRLMRNFQTIDFKRMFSAFDWMVEEGRKAKLVEETGWLPHETTPFHLLESELDQQEASDIIAQHYTDEWEVIEQTFQDRLAEYDVDDEAKDTLREALQAHRHGLFRVAPRLLFPEIERVAADEFYDGKHVSETPTDNGKTKRSPITSLVEVRESAWDLPLGDVAAYEYSWHLFKKLEAHLYEKVGEDEAALAKIRADPVPNRRAALHGLICYKTQQNSLNAIIMTDFMFHLISQIKKYQVEGEEE